MNIEKNLHLLTAGLLVSVTLSLGACKDNNAAENGSYTSLGEMNSQLPQITDSSSDQLSHAVRSASDALSAAARTAADITTQQAADSLVDRRDEAVDAGADMIEDAEKAANKASADTMSAVEPS